MAANNFTEATSKTLNAAVELATSKGHALVEPAHVAAKLFASGELGDRVAKKAGADAAALRDRLATAVDARRERAHERPWPNRLPERRADDAVLVCRMFAPRPRWAMRFAIQ